MSDAEERVRKERRRLIERLNEKEKLIGPQNPVRSGQRSEEELEAEIEEGAERRSAWLRPDILVSSPSIHPTS